MKIKINLLIFSLDFKALIKIELINLVKISEQKL